MVIVSLLTGLTARLRSPSVTNEPPAPGELRRNDWAVAAVVAFALFLGLGIRQQSLHAHRTFALGDGLPTIDYPAGWRTAQPELGVFRAMDPASPSPFSTQIIVAVRESMPGETLDQARATWGLQRSQQLLLYRERIAEPLTVLDGEPAIRTRYAYVADPTREYGATGLPVVVEGEDLLFFAEGRFVAVTVAADASAWEAAGRHFAVVWRSLNVQAQAADPLLVVPSLAPGVLPTQETTE